MGTEMDIQHIALVRAPTKADGSMGAKHRHRLIKGENEAHLQCLVYQGYRIRERYGGRETDRPF